MTDLERQETLDRVHALLTLCQTTLAANEPLSEPASFGLVCVLDQVKEMIGEAAL